MDKKPINQHKQMAMGDLNVGYKKGGKVKEEEKDMKQGGSCKYKKGGNVKKKK